MSIVTRLAVVVSFLGSALAANNFYLNEFGGRKCDQFKATTSLTNLDGASHCVNTQYFLSYQIGNHATSQMFCTLQVYGQQNCQGAYNTVKFENDCTNCNDGSYIPYNGYSGCIVPANPNTGYAWTGESISYRCNLDSGE